MGGSAFISRDKLWHQAVGGDRTSEEMVADSGTAGPGTNPEPGLATCGDLRSAEAGVALHAGPGARVEAGGLHAGVEAAAASELLRGTVAGLAQRVARIAGAGGTAADALPARGIGEAVAVHRTGLARCLVHGVERLHQERIEVQRELLHVRQQEMG